MADAILQDLAPTPARRKRTRVLIESGIRRDQIGFEAYVYAGGRQLAKRFPQDASLREMRAWRELTRKKLQWAGRIRRLTSNELPAPKPIPRHLDGWCHVYFVECGGRIKIGRATDVARRMREMRTFMHEPLTLLVAVPAHGSLEKLIHERFSGARVQGEWYEFTEELEAFIERLRAGLNPLLMIFDERPANDWRD